jgi:predicted ribosomally synthesized peptide with nif11-like leader
MRSAELERLMSYLRGEEALRREFHRLGNDFERIVGLAREKGYRLIRQDAEALAKSLHELSDEELDEAAGGAWNDPPPPDGTGG